MKKLLLSILALSASAFGADKQISELTAATSAASGDVLHMQMDVSGTFRDRKITFANFKTSLSLQPLDSDLTSWASVTRASGFDTFVVTPSSANLLALLTTKTGTGNAVFSISPTFTGTINGAALNLSGTVTATAFSGSGASLTNIPNAALDNSSITIGSTSVSLGGTAATVGGLTLTSAVNTTNAITITNTATSTLPKFGALFAANTTSDAGITSGPYEMFGVSSSAGMSAYEQFNYASNSDATLNSLNFGLTAVSPGPSLRIFSAHVDMPNGPLKLGNTGSVAGSITFAGSTSGTVTVQAAAAAGTPTLTLPTTTGTIALTTDITGGTRGASFTTGAFSGQVTIAKTSAVSTRETLLKGSVSDAGNDAIYIYNGTLTDSRFAPSFGGYLDTTNNAISLGFSGAVSSGNDASDSGTLGIVNFNGARTSSASDPFNGTLSAVVNRKLFTFTNNASALFTIYPTTANFSSTITGVTINGTTDSTTKDTGCLILEGGLGVEKAVNIGTTLAVNGAIISTPQALTYSANPTVIPVTAGTVALTSTAAANAFSLANGTAGQIIRIVHIVKGTLGTCVITPATAVGFTSATLTNAGDTVTLQYFSTGWVELAHSTGTTITP